MEDMITLTQAIAHRATVDKAIHHSDRCAQYTSVACAMIAKNLWSYPEYAFVPGI
jgi:hypothetical protein